MKDDFSNVKAGGTAADRTDRLTRATRDQSFPNVRPRDSATLILIDRATPVPKVLLGRRHHGLRFMPGKFVFPGGRIEPEDRLMAASADLHERHLARLMQRMKRPTLAKAAAFALTAVREVFEETSVRSVLGPRLPAVEYQVGDARKRIDYWSVFSPGDQATASHEIDAVCWLPLPEAIQRLSYPRDAAVLAALQPRATVPLILLRHASAGEKADWPGDGRGHLPCSPRIPHRG